jgi:membrane protease YdiL (CAAX protease family)
MDAPRVDSPDAVDHPSPFWSPWATVGWGLLIAIGFVLVQAATVVAWSAMRSAKGADPDDLAAELAVAGDLLSVATLISATVGSLLIFAVLAVGRGIRVREAIALRAPTSGSAALWMAVTAGLIAASDALTWSLDKPIVPEFMSDLIRSATIAPLLWLAIIVAAPVFEELFFRGFLIEGLRRGVLGDAGAVVVTSLSWASIHLQYGLYEIGTIFIFGLALGLARIGSRSLWVPVAMHMLANLVATLEAYLLG